MKTLGLLGGMSWESTAVYYRRLNQLARDRYGAQHSARLLIWSTDFAPLVALQAAGDWRAAGAVLAEAAASLEAAGAGALVICANTMHRVAREIEAATSIPLLHVADATAAAIRSTGVKRPVLLATRFTMEQTFWRDRLAAGGVEAIVPPADDRRHLHAIIYDQLVQGRFEEDSKRKLVEIARRAASTAAADGVILGCTELGLLVTSADFDVPVFDTTELHALAAMDFAAGVPEPAVLRLARPGDAGEIAELYLASFADALPTVRLAHSDAEVRAWIPGVVLKRGETWVACRGGRIVGFINRVGEAVDSLYVAPGRYRQGIGSALLAKAKAGSPSGLRLFTFQCNARARAFYEAQGFRIVDMNDGTRNEEKEPDILYGWDGRTAAPKA